MHKKKILIVDDEYDITEFLSYNFKKREFEVRVAMNGIEAQQILLTWLPDIIITDILMPEQNGIGLCHDLKNNILTKNIPVVFLSASSDEYHALAAMDAGGVHYISKPVRLEILFKMVEEVLIDAQKG
ncbi:MAG: response regulator [Bacteroidia bacterium]|nr:response regulator [Bacteroidia bacterium]